MDPDQTTEQEVTEKGDSRLRILYLYQMLRYETDESHALTTNEILDRMESEHGIKMHRTTLARDVEVLRASGIDVVSDRKRSMQYSLCDSPLSVPELRLLIDAVLSSKFITERKSSEMIEKLISLTSSANADKLQRTIHVTGKAKSENEKGYYIVDAINEAINLGRKISFFYFDYDILKQPVLRNDGNPYTVSPYDLIWDGDYYYLTGYCDEREDIRTFRVDRIDKQPLILSDPVRPKGGNYRVEKYTQEVFRMYSTQQTEIVSLVCAESLMKTIIDEFGPGVYTRPLSDDTFMARVKVCISPTFFRWVFGWDGKIRISSPARIQRQYKEMLRNEFTRYV